MSKKRKNGDSVRFYIKQKSKCSSIWIIWNNKNDLYAAVRAFAGVQKVSLHESEWLNFSFTAQYFKQHQSIDGHIGRHIGSQKLNIDHNSLQNVFKIEIPLGLLTEIKVVPAKEIEAISIPDEWIGMITVFITRIPDIYANKLDCGSIPNYIMSFCNGRYVLRWEHNSTKEVKEISDLPCGMFESKGEIQDLREVSFGFDDEYTTGGFIDKKFVDYHLLP